MSVKVRLSTLLRQATEWQEIIEVEAYTPLECLRDIEHRFPAVRKWIYDKDGKMWDRLQFHVNGTMISTDELGDSLHDNDELYILLNIGGG